MGWLTDLTNWIREQIIAFWTAFKDFMGDLIVMQVKAFLDLVEVIVNSIPVPDFITGTSIGAMLAQSSPDLLWFVTNLKIAEGMAFLAAGYTFRLLRKLLTLGQW